MAIGVLVAGLPTLYYYYPTRTALTVPLPLAPGTFMRQGFAIRGLQSYDFIMQCREVGEFKERWKDFMNWKTPPEITCDITLRVIRNGTEIHSEHLQSLKPSSKSGDVDTWQLCSVDLSTSNAYELQLTNGTDLSYLLPTRPIVKIRLNSLFLKEGPITAFLGWVIGGLAFICGLGLLCFGLLSRSKAANQSPDRTAASRGVCRHAQIIGRQIRCWQFQVVGGCRSAHR